jgi:hypothetical protein
MPLSLNSVVLRRQLSLADNVVILGEGLVLEPVLQHLAHACSIAHLYAQQAQTVQPPCNLSSASTAAIADWVAKLSGA